jgi:hypothetical protein
MAGLILIAGCRTDREGIPSRGNLEKRIGSLTYDEALRLLGPPESTLELSDHSKVVAWEAGAKSTPSFSFGLGSSSGDFSASEATTVGGSTRHIYRELQFDASGRLTEVRDVLR